ncbi:class I SAM-dependent methyltransferase [Roseibium denhamense]|uniref:16S rRNA m(2)G 1207 methyltransferase n=1 Tax=Roseibium denhamense TaxID=76305 RepID=A0ABY1P811_9HYPH|nr:class I SAM-dependent methyltransferase [Roseibium denhamense]MTI07126.1 class I SAM-dependent methyltransferase [Roseibium denhamense]SMP26946.1 16S rRNA m(2)G 1207 methyltransferase [Roseibium denhamense]
MDPALETLTLPIAEEAVVLSSPARILFLRARAGQPLNDFGNHNLVCEQSFAPDRDALQRSGVTVEAEVEDTGFDAVLVLPGRQRQEARAQLARAVAKCRDGGTLIACAPNSEGAKTLESDLAALLGPVDKLSKNKCRAVWGLVQKANLDQDLLAEWLELDAVRPVLDGAYVSRPGVFAWDRIDPASRLLADNLPLDLKGRGADLGAGFGFLSRAVLERSANVAAMDLYEAEKRALDLASENLAAFKGKKTLNGIWSDVTKGLEGPYDFIVSNPPFHQTGKADRADVGQGFIRAAAGGLRPGGVFYMVANRHLPYEHTLKEVFASVDMLADEGGYKVLKAVKAKGGR